MTESNAITKNQLVTELTKSPHGDLTAYLPICVKAVTQEPEFFAHLIAYNELKGQIRDSKVALPVISLTSATTPTELVSNSLAHLALLSPRDLVRALRFSRSLSGAGRNNSISRLVTRYLRARESNYAWFERQAMQHRVALKELYSFCHVKPAPWVDAILFKNQYPVGSVFDAISKLRSMGPTEAAGTILERRIPFMTAAVALQDKLKSPDVVLALISRMTPTQLVTNTKMLERLGISTNPVLRAAYNEAMEKAGAKKTKSSSTATFKSTVAATATMDEQATEPDPIREKLRALQEKQIATVKREAGINGDWLVLGDKSGSMAVAIETSRLVAGTLAKLVTGAVELVFFDTSIHRINATNKTYDQLVIETQFVRAAGGTSIGCGLQWALDSKRSFDGIVIVSDGAENYMPRFAGVYKEYCQRLGVTPVVYWYQVTGTDNIAYTDEFVRTCHIVGLDLQLFDIRGGVDHYSLTNLARTMRVNRYSLVEEIMETPLLDLDAILPVTSSSAGS